MAPAPGGRRLGDPAAVASRRALGLPGTVDRGAARRRPTHPPTPPGVAAVSRAGRRTSSPCAAAAPVQLYLKGFPDDATSRAAWRQERPCPARGADHAPARSRRRRLAVPRGPAAHRAARPRCRHAGGRHPAAVVRDVSGMPARTELRVTVVRYQPEASVTLRSRQPEAARPPGCRPAVYRQAPRRGTVAEIAARHQALWASTGPGSPLCGSPSRWPRPGTAACCGRRGVRGSAADRDRAPGPAARGDGAAGAAAGRACTPSSGSTTSRIGVDGTCWPRRTRRRQAGPGPAPIARLVADRWPPRRPAAAPTSGPRASAAPCTATSTSTSWSPPTTGRCSSTSTRCRAGPPRSTWPSSSSTWRCGTCPGVVTHEVAHALLVVVHRRHGGRHRCRALLCVCADAEFVNRCYRHLRRHPPGWQPDLEAELARHRRRDVAAPREVRPAVSRGRSPAFR